MRDLKEARLARGKRQEDIARVVGVNQSTVSRMESGQIRTNPERLRQIMDAIDASPLPDPDVELAHDLSQDVDILEHEAQILQDGIVAAAERIGRGQDRELNLRLVAHAVRRARAILKALNLRVQSLKPT